MIKKRNRIYHSAPIVLSILQSLQSSENELGLGLDRSACDFPNASGYDVGFAFASTFGLSGSIG